MVEVIYVTPHKLHKNGIYYTVRNSYKRKGSLSVKGSKIASN